MFQYLKKILTRQVRPLDIVFSLILLAGVAVGSMPTEFYRMILTPEAPGDSGLDVLRINNTSGTKVFSIDDSGNLTKAGGETPTDVVSIPITSFSLDGVPLAGTTSSNAYIGEVNESKMAGTDSNPAIILSSSGLTPFEAMFRVPDNYLESPVFKVLASSNETGAYPMPSLNFAVKVHTTTSMDEAFLSQSPVQLSSTPTEATLTVVTDFESLAAGNWVTLRLNRNAVGAADVNIYNIAFEYTKKY